MTLDHLFRLVIYDVFYFNLAYVIYM